MENKPFRLPERKVEEYLRQNEESIRHYQEKYADAKHVELINLRSLTLNSESSAQRVQRALLDLSYHHSKDEKYMNLVQKSSSMVSQVFPVAKYERRKFHGREWVFEKLWRCLEIWERHNIFTGFLILGSPGTGKTMLCQELCRPTVSDTSKSQLQIALNKRLLAKYFIRCNSESHMKAAEFVRSMVLQLLSHSSRYQRLCIEAKQDVKKRNFLQNMIPADDRCEVLEHHAKRFANIPDDGEDCTKPLLADSDDEEEVLTARRNRTIDKIHERRDYLDSMPQQQEARQPTEHKMNETACTSSTSTSHGGWATRGKGWAPDLIESSSHANATATRSVVSTGSNSSAHSSATGNAHDAKKSDQQYASVAKSSKIPVSNFRYPNKSELRPSELSPHKAKQPESLGAVPKLRPVPVEYDGPRHTNALGSLNKNLKEEVIRDRTAIADAYYDKFISDWRIRHALSPHNLETKPVESFEIAFLYPLHKVMKPKNEFIMLIDDMDEGAMTAVGSDDEEPLKRINSVAKLLLMSRKKFPRWLHIVGTARKNSWWISRFIQFKSYQTVFLDEFENPDVSGDVQKYVISRLESEQKLRARISGARAAAKADFTALDNLCIKSVGSMLYLEKVLDGVSDGSIRMPELNDIPATLNGLFLWHTRRVFNTHNFKKVRLLLEVLLVADGGVTEGMLYKCLLTKECGVTRKEYNKRLHMLKHILVIEDGTGYLRIFHHSYAHWLHEVKYCTPKYLCVPGMGHATLAMYYSLEAHRLSPEEVHNFVFHMLHWEKHMEQEKKRQSGALLKGKMPLRTLILLWVLDTGCDVDSALRPYDSAFLDELTIDENIRLLKASNQHVRRNPPPESILSKWLMEQSLYLRDEHVVRVLILMSRDPHDTNKELEVAENSVPVMYSVVNNRDNDALQDLLKRSPESAQAMIPEYDAPPLLLAARSKHDSSATARLLLSHGADPNTPDTDMKTPLITAASEGHVAMAEVLLQFGANVNTVETRDNSTALHVAVRFGHGDFAKCLLAHGADVAIVDVWGKTPLFNAATKSDIDLLRMLINAGSDVNHASKTGETPLFVVVGGDRSGECAALLLDRGADVSRTDLRNSTPLHMAANHGDVACVELYLEHEADMEAVDSAGRTALWLATTRGHQNIVRILLFWGASVDMMDDEGRTVLSIAAAQGNSEVVRLLLDRGLDEQHRDNSGRVPLHYAALEGHSEVCETLLEAGAKVDEIDNDGRTALMLSTQNGHINVISTLIDKYSAEIDKKAHDGKTAFMLAVLSHQVESCHVLCKHGANVDALDADGRSILYALVVGSSNNLYYIPFLLNVCKVDANTRDPEGRTPLHAAAWQNLRNIIELLVKEGGASIDARDNCFRTALHAAAWQGNEQALGVLLRLGADPSAVCSQGATPLSIAAQEGYANCVYLLMKYGANEEHRDHCGRTAIEVAKRLGRTNVCDIIELCVKQRTPNSLPYEITSTIGLANNTATNESCYSYLPLSRDKESRGLEADKAASSPAQDANPAGNVRSRGDTSPLYASPPRSPPNELDVSPGRGHPTFADEHFNRDTHMRIILGRDAPQDGAGRSRRSAGASNPAMRLVANVRNGLDNAAANIRRTGVALAQSASSSNPAVRTNAFQWRKETPL